MKSQPDIQCPLCERIVPSIHQEKHHLIPKCKKGKETVVVCCDCGDMIHQLFDEKILARNLNSIDNIRNEERMLKWIAWIRKKPNHFRINMKKKKRR